MSVPPGPVCRNAQRPELAGLFLRDQDLSHRFWLVGPFPQIPRQFPEPLVHTLRRDVHELFPVDPGRAAIVVDPVPGFIEEIHSPDLVGEGVKTAVGFFLRFRMEHGLEFPNLL